MTSPFSMGDFLTQERPKREKRVREGGPDFMGPPKPPKAVKQRYRRYGAYLKLYGPIAARTHARLVFTVEPEDNTPEGFLAELEVEEKTNNWAMRNGCGTQFNIALAYGRR